MEIILNPFGAEGQFELWQIPYLLVICWSTSMLAWAACFDAFDRLSYRGIAFFGCLGMGGLLTFWWPVGPAIAYVLFIWLFHTAPFGATVIATSFAIASWYLMMRTMFPFKALRTR